MNLVHINRSLWPFPLIPTEYIQLIATTIKHLSLQQNPIDTLHITLSNSDKYNTDSDSIPIEAVVYVELSNYSQNYFCVQVSVLLFQCSVFITSAL
jgi:hypothetical protein